MEQSQVTNDGYFSQLEVIKNIQNSIAQIKTRIECMQKEENRKVKQYQKAFTSSIPLIKNKISQYEHIIKKKNVKAQSQYHHLQKIEEIKMSRLDNQCEINRTRLDIYKSKVNESMHIREISKKNQKIIEEARQQWLAEKKKKSELVKMEKQESRRKIQQFHVQKQTQLKKQKSQEKVHLQKQIKRIGGILIKMAKVEEKQEQNCRSQQKVLYKLKNIVNQLNGMKPEQFSEIIQTLNLNTSIPLDDVLITRILLEVQKRRSQLQPQNYHKIVSKDRTNNSKYIKSISFDINTIYGGTNRNFYKKIR